MITMCVLQFLSNSANCIIQHKTSGVFVGYKGHNTKPRERAAKATKNVNTWIIMQASKMIIHETLRRHRQREMLVEASRLSRERYDQLTHKTIDNETRFHFFAAVYVCREKL